MASDNDAGVLERFYSDGYVVEEGAVDGAFCREALREVNQLVGDPSVKTSLDKMISSSRTVTRLFNDSGRLLGLLGTILGSDTLVPYLQGAQLALRFPGTLCMPGTFEPVHFWKSVWHIDGLPSPENGIPVGSIKNFTLLVGALEELSGNLVLFPRSHHLMERYFQTEGFEAAKSGLAKLPPLPLADPVQVRLKRGDVVVAHYQLCHSIAPNLSPDIRYMVYFRVNVRQGDHHHPEPMLDIWQDYNPAFRELQRRLPVDQFLLGPTHSSPSSSSSSFASVSPGYIDAVNRQNLGEALVSDVQRHQELAKAEELFEAHRWAECAPLISRLADAKPNDVLLCLKAGLCWSAGDKQHLPEGERRLRKLTTDLAPFFSEGWVWLSRNLARQVRELSKQELRDQAIACAKAGLLEKASAPDIAVEAIKVLSDLLLEPEQMAPILTAAQQRYPSLAEQLGEAGKIDVSKKLWVEGHRWLSSSDPKDLAAGLRIFSQIVAAAPQDYWAHVLNAGCLIWSGRPAGALPLLQTARQIDPAFPHGYVAAAQALNILDRKSEALELVHALFARGPGGIKCQEPDHFKQVLDGLQLAADLLLPQQPALYESLRSVAISIFPQLAPQFHAIVKQDGACSIV